MKRVLLINMPFAEIVYPSLALGLFKARLGLEGIPCRVEHLNILFAEMVGWDNYNSLSQMTAFFAGEQMFAHTLFGDHIPGDNRYYSQVVSRTAPDMPPRLREMKARVEPFLSHCLENVPWQQYDIIGFTSLFEQNLPALALAYRVKRKYPHKIVVFGGSNCEDKMGLTLHKCFPFVDFVFPGEADDTFPELVKRLIYDHPVHNLPGIVYRRGGESVYTGDAPATRDLDALPYPDYDEYYERLRRSPIGQGLHPYLLLETSRGCWWGAKSKCTFCGLNGKIVKYRRKSDQRIIDEFRYLTGRYDHVFFIKAVDNVLDPKLFDYVLPEIARLNPGVQLYFEVRPNLQKHQVKMLAQAGVANIQPGIESLASHTLKLMKKGSSPLQNIQLLKWSKQYGIGADWNILFGFAGETPRDYAQNLEYAKLLGHLNSPSGFGPFRMDRFSHNFENAERAGFTNVRPQKIFSYLYPFNRQTLEDLVYHFGFDYDQKIDDGGYRAPLTRQILHWKSNRYQLYSQRCGDKVAVYDTRPGAVSPYFLLHGIRKEIYEYCDAVRTPGQIARRLQEALAVDMAEDRIEAILREFVAQKIMVREKKSYLALAVMTYTADWEKSAGAEAVPKGS